MSKPNLSRRTSVDEHTSYLLLGGEVGLELVGVEVAIGSLLTSACVCREGYRVSRHVPLCHRTTTTWMGRRVKTGDAGTGGETTYQQDGHRRRMPSQVTGSQW